MFSVMSIIAVLHTLQTLHALQPTPLIEIHAAWITWLWGDPFMAIRAALEGRTGLCNFALCGVTS
jgi:hypothetical protein